MPVANSISSNVVGLSFAEEISLKTLPGSPIWFLLEPNGFGDFGAKLSKVARNPINPLRQLKKGTITDLDASAAFGIDMTQNNLIRLMQGFFFRDAFEKADNKSFNAANVTITSIDAVGAFLAASGLTIFRVGDLIKTTKNTVESNNDFGLVTAVVSTKVTTDISTTIEASPSSDSRIQAVGFEFATGDATLTLQSGTITLNATAKDMTQFALTKGEWIYIGGDDGSNQFGVGTFYARVKSIAAGALVLDKVTQVTAADTGTGKDIRIFFGTMFKNADVADDIKCRSYQFERTLGKDANGTQSEYVKGAVANEFTLNMPVAAKLIADLGFVGLDTEERTGLQGLKTGARVSALGEDAYNTSSDVFRTRMSIIDTATLDPTDLFAFLSDFNIKIENNVTALKAVGVIGGFSLNIGNFKVSGTATAYFSTVAAITAVRANSDVTLDAIFAKKNAGFIFDIPLLGVSIDNLAIELNSPVTVPVEQDAAESPLGHTLALAIFNYLPNAAMPVAS